MGFHGTKRCLIAGILGALSQASPARADEMHLLTMAEAAALVDSGHYYDALAPLQRLLDLKGQPAEKYDRHALLMLRAECQLQIKESKAALDTLEIARKEAAEKNDDTARKEALSLSFLIQKSPGFLYTPRIGPLRKPVPILDHTLRKAAYNALFADEFAPLEAKAREAVKQDNIAPTFDTAKNILAIESVEWASTPTGVKTKKLIESLTGHALSLLQAGLDTMQKRQLTISDLANKIVTEERTVYYADGSSDVQDWTHKVGLTKADAQTLLAIELDCAKIPQAAAELSLLLGGESKYFKALAAAAEKVGQLANKTRTDKY